MTKDYASDGLYRLYQELPGGGTRCFGHFTTPETALAAVQQSYPGQEFDLAYEEDGRCKGGHPRYPIRRDRKQKD